MALLTLHDIMHSNNWFHYMPEMLASFSGQHKHMVTETAVIVAHPCCETAEQTRWVTVQRRMYVTCEAGCCSATTCNKAQCFDNTLDRTCVYRLCDV